MSPAATGGPRVAVLGGAGFAGENVTRELLAAGVTAKTFSRRNGCDLLQEVQATATVQAFRPTHLINCAAVVGSVNYVSDLAADVVDANARIALGVYRVARALPGAVVINLVANCVYPGTMDLYDEARLWDGPLHESVRSYGESRRLLLTLADCYRDQYGIGSANLIVPNMYGPHDSTDPNKTHALNALILKFARAVRDGAAEVEVWGTGTPVREWLYAPDLARVVREVVRMTDPLKAPVNVAQNRGSTVREIVEMVVRATGFEGRIRYDTTYGDGAPRKVMDDARFRTWFPEFRFTPMETGIAETLIYYRGVLAR